MSILSLALQLLEGKNVTIPALSGAELGQLLQFLKSLK